MGKVDLGVGRETSILMKLCISWGVKLNVAPCCRASNLGLCDAKQRHTMLPTALTLRSANDFAPAYAPHRSLLCLTKATLSQNQVPASPMTYDVAA